MHIDQIFRRSVVSVALSLALLGGVTVAQADTSAVFGRWTAIEKTAFSDNGMFYKTIDVVACEAGMCGVSVGDDGECGSELFQLTATQAKGSRLSGQARWGKLTRDVQIDFAALGAIKAKGFMLSLVSEEGSFQSRLASMPDFTAFYSPAGKATCPAKKPVS